MTIIVELFAFIIVDIINWLRGEVTCTTSDPIPTCTPKEIGWLPVLCEISVWGSKYYDYNFSELEKGFLYPHDSSIFFLFVLAFIFTSLRFSRVEFYLHLFSLPIFGCFLQKGPLKFSFSKIVTAIEASEIYCFREPLHVSNVSAFQEKWRKWQSVRNALRIPGFIVQINKLIVPLNKNVHCRAFTTLDNYACLWILNMQSRHLVPLAPLSIGAGKAVHIQ